MLSPGFFNQPDHLQIPSDPGTYALILKNISHKKVQIGKWGQIQLKPGFYIYVGSAFGPGGLKARLSRHLRIKKTKRWHIDYLRDFVSPYSVWYSYDSDHLEHRWALAICNINGMVPIKGFGSSDCKCIAHLFWTLNEPNFSEFLNMICGRVDLFAC
jgi:Uri superfamily endonuclease